ncbi:uncharacterized protein LOC111635024 [Centruroides sculpturatus]|uniref:uncharacterized protein LOC111635024 n=1 Tax=Centruroides sculpturatus TaxID=218467 RepID=UPI000C6EFE20|nr:uncharacterized protein LOC111635024 [Centruroides sculpturatus]
MKDARRSKSGENIQKMVCNFYGAFSLKRTKDHKFVGAGTAGCVLAGRLSEAGNVRVLLIEAGEEEENHRGKKGPCKVTEFDAQQSKVAKALMESARRMGVDCGDLNNLKIEGVAASQNNIYEGRRWSTFRGYLESIGKRPNLDVVTGFLATKILFRGKTAAGVEILSVGDGTSLRVFARREIVLCAGVVGSPHLLLLSGVGPARQLRKYKISVVSDLPDVGQNLQDHLAVPLYFHLDLPVSVNLAKVKSFYQIWNYIVHGSGLLSNSGIEMTARMFRPGSINNSSRPEFFFLLFNVGSIDKDIFGRISNMRDDIFDQSFPDYRNESKEGFVLLSSCLHPSSKGSVSLQSANPTVPPLIDPRYLSEERDIRCSVQAMETGIKLVTSDAFREMGVRLHLPKFSNCSGNEAHIGDREFLKCWFQTNAITGNHPLGTNRMGDDNRSVLDPYLRVRGIRNLRVVDASSIPGQLSGPPNAVVVALAEKAADIIKSSLRVASPPN